MKSLHIGLWWWTHNSCVFEMFATKSKLHINFQNLSGRGEEDETHMVTNLTLLQMSHITTLKGVK